MDSEKHEPSGTGNERSAADDLRLAEILEEVSLRREAGEKPSLSEYQSRHPELAARLSAVFSAFDVIKGLGETAAGVPQFADDAPQTAGAALGDFQIVREIGRGGMGVVYEATQLSLGRSVALKVLPFASMLDSVQIQRFRNEAQAAAQLHHASIVPVYGVGCDRGVHYYAMQLIDGQPLDRVIAELRALEGGSEPEAELSPASSAVLRMGEAAPASTQFTPPPSGAAAGLTPRGSTRHASFFRGVARVAIQAAEALAHAHDLGIVHRDVKPSNLLVDGRGHVWLTDFGLARTKQSADLTLTGDLVGTLRYMSPEQATPEHLPVDQRADVYSLGATMYELLTQRPLWEGNDRAGLLDQLRAAEPKPPRRWNSSLPADLETIVLKAVEKEPRSRFQSARALADDLERFLEDRPIAARRPGILHRASKWARRHRILVGAAAAILVTVAIAGVVTRDARREAARTEYAERLRAALAELETLRLYFPQQGGEEGYSYRLRPQQYSYRPEDYDARVSHLRSELEALSDLLPGRPDAPYHLARLESELGQTDRAFEVCDTILGSHPGFVAARALKDELGGGAGPAKDREVENDPAQENWSRHWLAARQATASRDWDRAVENWTVLCDQALSGTPEPYVGMSYEALLSRGRVRLELEDCSGAADDFATAVGFLAEALPVRLYLVLAHLQAKRPADARRIAEEAFRHLRQTDETPYWLSTLHEGSAIREARFWAQRIQDEGVREALMVLILITLREYPAAIKAGERAWDLRPSDMAIAHATITAALAVGRLEYAREVLSRMIARDPDHTETLNASGHVALYRNRPQEALEAYQEVMRRNPASTDNLASAYRDLGEFDTAFELWNERTRKWWKAASLREWGWTLCQLGRLPEAHEKLERIVAISPEDPPNHSCLGQTLLRLGDREGARKEYKEALRLQPNLPGVHNTLAGMLDADGDKPGALHHSLEAVRHGNGSVQVFGRIAGLLRSTGSADQPVEWDEIRGRAVDELEGLIGKQDAAPDLLLGVSGIGRAFVPSRLDLDRALAHGRAAVAAGIERESLLHGWLAEVALRARNGREAVLALEAGLRNPRALRGLEGQLAATRRSVRPLLPTFGSIDAALEERDAEIILPRDAKWRFFRGREEPPAGWEQPDFDDAGWESGMSGLGYGDGDDATTLLDMQGAYTTVYARTRFDVDDPARFEGFVLDVLTDDGFVAWLNGVEVGRVRAGRPGTLVHHADRADMSLEEAEVARLAIPRSAIRPGENVLAVAGLNATLDSSDFSLAPSVLGLPPLSPELRERFRANARASAPSSEDDSLELYLEARLAEIDGDLEAAAERFETLVARTAGWTGPRPVEPILGLARVLEAAERTAEAEKALRSALSIGMDDRIVWEAWLKVCLLGLKLDATATRSRMPRVEPREGRHDAAAVDAADVAWLLETFARGEALRIDCGAEDGADVAPAWHRDSFALGGNTAGKVVLDIFETEEDGLYQTGRVFPAGQALPAAYRIPIPPGRYRVTLHFAAVHWLEDRRAFDIRLEGALDEQAFFDLGTAPFRTAIVRHFETDVTDGFLDLELVLRKGAPRISAIEVVGIGGPSPKG